MRVCMRTGRRSGISLGPVALILLWPVWGTWFMLVTCWLLVKYLVLAYIWAGKGIVALCHASAAAYRSWRAGTLRADARRVLSLR